MQRWLVGFLVALIGVYAVMYSGCDGRPEFTTMEGTISYKGAPLPAGLVVVTNEPDTLSASGYLKGDGTYTVANAPVGPVRVTVRTNEFKDLMSGKAAADLRARGIPGPIYDEKVKGFKYVPIPERYGDREASGLKLELKPRTMNRFDIDLTP